MNNQLGSVLLIEDDPMHRSLIVGLLKTAGVDPTKIVWTETLKAGLDHLANSHPDAVLLDLNLPDCTGLDTLSAVNLHSPAVPVVVITGDDDEDQAILAMQLGAQDYLIKGQVDGPLMARSLHYAVERKRAERSLRCERDFAEGLIESTQALIILLDTAGHILRLNAFAAEKMGFPPGEVLGENWLQLLVPSSQQPDMQRFFEVTIAAKDTCFEAGQITTKDGDVRTIHWAARAIRDQEEHVTYVLLTGHDVTELEQAQQRALVAERLAVIGQMITGLAHESRNALQRSQACLSLLTRVIGENPKALDYADRLQTAQDYLRHIFEEVRNYAAPLRLELENSDVRQLITETWDQLASLGNGKRIQLDLNDTDLDLHCDVDRFRIQQVYRNILENAVSACDEPVNISVTWSEVDVNRSPALQTRIRDNGPGFSPEQRQQVFEPFYTTKTTGTGLGLAISKRIVEGHGGQIEIGDQSGQGAEILVTLPRRRER